MAKRVKHLDYLLKHWEYEPGQPLVRLVTGEDQREVLQLRVDMGILQMEVVDRPDGTRPDGLPTYYDYLVALAFQEGAAFELDEERCSEVDREFYQFYHRRIAWLSLKEYAKAVADAQHTLRMMDFTTANAPDEEWALMHEQYRPFVLFHKVQATALMQLEDSDAQTAIEVIDDGLKQLEQVFTEHGVEDRIDEDIFVNKLREMRKSVKEHYELGPTLAEQLAKAIATEQYELAAKLRDKLGEGGKN